MLELTLNNHFQFGRQSEDDKTFISQCGLLHRTPETGFKEAQTAASLIAKQAEKLKLKLCLSGGIDSACMLEAFTEQGLTFEVVFLRFNHGFNEFDICTNIQLCEQKKIAYSFVDLDIIDFFDSGKYLETAERYQCQSPQITTHLWFLDQIDGFPVLGGNPIMPIWNNEKWFFVGLPGELHCAYFKYFYIRERPGVPWFFMYTPELISSFFYTASAKKFLEKKVFDVKDYTYLQKCQSYKESGFSLEPRKNKFTGFELVRKHYDEKFGMTFGRAFDVHFRRPLEKLFPFPERFIQLVPSTYFPNGSI